jgi:hypothetical protein
LDIFKWPDNSFALIFHHTGGEKEEEEKAGKVHNYTVKISKSTGIYLISLKRG